MLGPVLFLLYTYDIPQTEGTTIATIVDDTAILSTGKTIRVANRKLQRAETEMNTSTKKWRIHINDTTC